MTTHVLIGALYLLPYGFVKDFEPVGQIATEPLLIVMTTGMAHSHFQPD